MESHVPFGESPVEDEPPKTLIPKNITTRMAPIIHVVFCESQL